MNDFIERHYDQWVKYLKKHIPETEVCDVLNDVLVSIYDGNFDLMNDFIERHYDQWVKYLKKHIPETEVCDVLNDVLVSIYDRNFDLMKLDRPDLYVINACKTAWFSKQSNYSRKRKLNYPTSPLEDYSEVLVVEEEDDTKTAEEIIYIIDHSPFCWWEKELFKRKALEGKTLDEMALECNLSKGQVWYSYNKVRMWLQKNLYKINI